MLAYGLTLFTAFCVTYFLTPIVIKAAVHFKAVDYPEARKVHQTPVPRWGGIGLALGILAGTLLAYFFSPSFHSSLNEGHRADLLGIGGACLLMLFVGMADDLHPVPAKIKLLWQLAAAAWLIFFGVRISFITVPFHKNFIYLPAYVGIIVSLLWIVGITNALNLLDGLDGLLPGISSISSLALFGVAIEKGYLFPAFILIAMCGATLAFLRYNFNPAKIFLGDSGSLFLGVLWASISIAGALKTPTTALFVPFLILGLPIADTFLALIRRFGKGRSIFQPDKEHLHHRLLALGWSQRKAVIVLYITGGILGMIALSLNHWLK